MTMPDAAPSETPDAAPQDAAPCGCTWSAGSWDVCAIHRTQPGPPEWPVGTPSKSLPLPGNWSAMLTVNPYTNEPWDAFAPPSLRWVPPEVVDEAGAKEAVRELSRRWLLKYGGRYCVACNADLGDVGSPSSSAPQGYFAATGQQAPEKSARHQGSHEVDCPVIVLLTWLGNK